MYKKAWCTCKVIILPTKPIAFWRCRYRGRRCFVNSLLSPTDYELCLWIEASVGNTVPPFRASPGSSVSSTSDLGTRLARPALAIFRSASRMPYSILPQKINLREDITSMWLYFVSLDKPKFLANEVSNATPRNERFIKIIRIPFKLKSPSKTHGGSLQKYFTRKTTSLVNIPLVPNS